MEAQGCIFRPNSLQKIIDLLYDKINDALIRLAQEYAMAENDYSSYKIDEIVNHFAATIAIVLHPSLFTFLHQRA
jgi:hypothetical protein